MFKKLIELEIIKKFPSLDKLRKTTTVHNTQAKYTWRRRRDREDKLNAVDASDYWNLHGWSRFHRYNI